MKEKNTQPAIFDKINYRWMLIGLGIMALGMLLMAGGKSTNPAIFEADSVYSARRITIAPLLILAGLVIEVYAIFKRPK